MKTITIEGSDEAIDLDKDLLMKCIEKAHYWAPGQPGYTATIYLESTGHNPPGWVEYLIVIMKDGVRNYTIAGIRRQPGLNCEFHS